MSYYGCYDMTGNVAEIVNDWYDAAYYSSSPYENPQGPPSGSLVIYRGGCYVYSAPGCRSAQRYPVTPAVHDGLIGFRCAKDIQ